MGMGNELILHRLCSNTHIRKARDQNMNSLCIELLMYLLAHHYPDLAWDLHNGSKLAVEKPMHQKKKDCWNASCSNVIQVID